MLCVKKKRIISALLCAAMIVSAGIMASSCDDNGGAASGGGDSTSDEWVLADKNVTMWGGFGQDYYENFQRDNPDIDLNYATSSDNSLVTLAAAIQSGNQPDMFYTNDAAKAPLGEAVGRDLLLPLEGYFDRDPNYKWEDLPEWYDMFVKYTGNDGQEHIYAVYTDVSVACLVWNKDLFEANGLDPESPPTTWSEMKTMANQLNQTDSNGMLSQAGFTSYNWWFQHWRLTYGTNYQDPLTGEPNINTPEMVNVMEFLRSFPESFGGADRLPETVSWGAGNVGMAIADTGYSQNMVNDFNTGIAIMPKPDDKEGDQVVAGYAWQWYGVPKGCKNPDGGWTVARWAVTNGSANIQAQAALENPETWVPVYQVHEPSKQELFDRYLEGCREDVQEMLMTREEIYDQISIARPVNAPINSNFEDALQQMCVEIINGETTVTDGLANIQNIGMRLYEDYRTDVLGQTE